jgi:phosphohistidine phosphatase
MQRELMILRHGKSSWDTGLADFERPLKDRGKRAAQRIGNWILQNDLLPDLVISSPATRALETARKCCKVMGIPGKAIQQDRRIYEASTDTLLRVLKEIPKKYGRVMLVGHNPGLEELVELLVNKPVIREEDGKLLPTGTLARLHIAGSWKKLGPAGASLIAIQRPRPLQKQFPWPAAHGTELRDRPAYYYTQSSVIPYRLHHGKPQFMIIRSSQDKHWVVPKGIVDPGYSPQDSAAKEAMEEAGIEGIVAEEAIGSYAYNKWGAQCTVSVYPMEVTHVIPEREWEEQHRGRRWVSAAEATALLKQTALYPMIAILLDKLEDDAPCRD